MHSIFYSSKNPKTMYQITVFLNHQISILKLFLKYYATLKAAEKADNSQEFAITGINYIKNIFRWKQYWFLLYFGQINAVFVSITDFFSKILKQS